MRKLTIPLILLWFLTSGCTDNFEDKPLPLHEPLSYTVLKFGDEITIDGADSETVWQKAKWTSDFIDIEGEDKPAPRFRTRVKMLWDNEYLYVFAEMEEPHVWGNITERDAVIFNNNDFEIFIKPDSYCSTYGEIEINALGTVWDLKLPRPYRNRGKADNGWNINGLKSAVRVSGTLKDPADTDSGWTVEFAIPLKDIAALCGKSLPSDGELWRINFSRVEWRHEIVNGKYRRAINPETGKRIREDNWVWSPQYAIDMHRPEHWGYLRFSSAPPGRAADDIRDPYSEEYQLLFALHREQLRLKRVEKRYAENIEELGGPAFLLKKDIVAAALLTKATGYLITVKASNGNFLSINELGDIKIEKK